MVDTPPTWIWWDLAGTKHQPPAIPCNRHKEIDVPTMPSNIHTTWTRRPVTTGTHTPNHTPRSGLKTSKRPQQLEQEQWSLAANPRNWYDMHTPEPPCSHQETRPRRGSLTGLLEDIQTYSLSSYSHRRKPARISTHSPRLTTNLVNPIVTGATFLWFRQWTLTTPDDQDPT